MIILSPQNLLLHHVIVTPQLKYIFDKCTTTNYYYTPNQYKI